MERIILAPGINETELLRTLATRGVSTLGTRIMGSVKLARTALMRSGIVCTEEFLPRKDEAALIDTFIRQTEYFGSASFADAENMASALFSLRSLIPENEAEDIHGKFCEGEFADKNKAIVEVYDRFISELANRGLIDSIGLIRKAVSEAEQLNCEIDTLREFELSPLEKSLAGKLTADGSKVKTVSVTDLFGTSDKAGIRNISYLESYGAANEVEDILASIAELDYPYDRCTVAVAETSRYAQLFYEYSQTYDIDVTFGCGIPITNSFPARLFRALYAWDTSGFHGVDALAAVIFSEATNRTVIMETLGISDQKDLQVLVSILGNLKCDRNVELTENKLNELAPVLETRLKDLEDGIHDHEYHKVADKVRLMDAARKLGTELAMGYSNFIRHFAYVRPKPVGRIDRAALNVICDAIDSYTEFSGRDDIDELVPELMNKTVCSEPAKEGALYVTGINGAFASLRDRLYVVGLSAGNYPGNPSENYLLLDSDYELFGKDMPTSVNRIMKKKQTLKSLLGLACSLDVPVQLSYSDYNPAEMSAANPSSVLYEIFKEEHGEKAGNEEYANAFRKTGYFMSGISLADEIGSAYSEGKGLTFTQETPVAESFSVTKSERGYSPSALEKFFGCPRKYMLNKVIGIEDEEATDPFTVINAKQFGTLAHSVLEAFADGSGRIGREEFLEMAGKAFDDFLKEYIPINRNYAKRERDEFLEVMENAYKSDPVNTVLSAEEKKTVEHESSIRLYGFPDRVEQDTDGKYLIADFKTGKTVKHTHDDIDTCLQVVIYAYMMEKLGMPVSYSEYRYLRKNKVVSCVYNDKIKEELSRKLEEFKRSLENGEFPPNPGKKNENCKYCTFADICGRGEV